MTAWRPGENRSDPISNVGGGLSENPRLAVTPADRAGNFQRESFARNRFDSDHAYHSPRRTESAEIHSRYGSRGSAARDASCLRADHGVQGTDAATSRSDQRAPEKTRV